MPDDQRNVESYARLYDDILDNEKMTRVGTMGFALYCAGLVYAHRNRTDGFIPTGKIPTLIIVPIDTPAILVDAELWEAKTGGWQIHDYLDHNASRDEIAAYGEQWRGRQSAGGRARAATATRVGGRFSTSDSTSVTSDSYSIDQRPTSDHQPVPAKEIREKGQEIIPLVLSSTSLRVPTAEAVKGKIDLAKEIGYLWKAHKGWVTWPKNERGQWWTIVRFVKKLPFPIEFWKDLIPTIDKSLPFAYLTTSPGPGLACLADERHAYWREEQWLEQKASFVVPPEMAALLEPIVRPKIVSWQ